MLKGYLKKKKTDKNKQKEPRSTWDREGQFCPIYSSSFSPPFSLHFGEIELWWAQRENSWAPPLFSPPPPLIQTPFPPIFSLFFHSFFSILPKIHPSKHSLSVRIIGKFEKCRILFDNIYQCLEGVRCPRRW